MLDQGSFNFVSGKPLCISMNQDRREWGVVVVSMYIDVGRVDGLMMLVRFVLLLMWFGRRVTTMVRVGCACLSCPNRNLILILW